MGEILFRGQTRRKGEYTVNMAQKECDSNWVYGGIFPQNNGGSKAIIYQQYPEIKKFVVYADTVGQYTGTPDKNKNKIFEHDIVKAFKNNDEPFVAVVTKRNGCFWFGNWNWCEFLDKFRNYEVIGNVFDNPELVKGGAE